MKEKDTKPEKFTGRLEISNVPIATINKVNEIADKKGITTTAYVKGIIHEAIKDAK